MKKLFIILLASITVVSVSAQENNRHVANFDKADSVFSQIKKKEIIVLEKQVNLKLKELQEYLLQSNIAYKAKKIIFRKAE
jgi:hypothetical protein